MPKKTIVKAKKPKLSPAERSQIAKDRWAKIKASKATQEATTRIVDSILKTKPVEQEPEFTPVPTTVNGVDEALSNTPNDPPPPTQYAPPVEPPAPPEITIAPVVTLPLVPTPAPVITPAKAPKQKRYTGPKEFSVALKAAENRLAKAITERAEAMGKLAGLNAEIPSLIQIIQALKGSGNGFTPAPYDPTLNMAFQSPVPQPANPLAAIQAAMDAAAQPPVFRASGGAVQLSPDVVGTLEGPDDDDSDIDRYITGASGPVAEGKWIGG